ncbi:hypothetical protein BJ965_001900 [Streptomyces luteogriseus]|uniref:XdhC Rossmann domain-containing protein n=1 Tax=Streptomyces luteogriseus TaxID=68233 RepID=A0A7W7DKA9_9ACTN|nr:XdhC family protein [Streptomyces luteogriseus]MBB4712018.1 hypothetical protein [Streptomyces luteogriseus]
MAAAHSLASALSQAGRFLGYHVTVCDARVFATPARFPHADEVVVDWPHRCLERTEVDERTAVCVLTHDAKYGAARHAELSARTAAPFPSASKSPNPDRKSSGPLPSLEHTCPGLLGWRINGRHTGGVSGGMVSVLGRQRGMNTPYDGRPHRPLPSAWAPYRH